MKAVFRTAIPYADDALNLPVESVDAAVPYYEETFGFQVVSREDTPHRRIVLARDDIRIGLAENGGDPAQEGCVFRVDDVEAAFREIKRAEPGPGDIETQHRKNGTSHRVFFVVAPDGLCYMISQPI